MWWYHVDTGTALHVLLDVTSLDILHPTVFSIKASGILVMLLLYMSLLKLRNSCRFPSKRSPKMQDKFMELEAWV